MVTKFSKRGLVQHEDLFELSQDPMSTRNRELSQSFADQTFIESNDFTEFDLGWFGQTASLQFGGVESILISSTLTCNAGCNGTENNVGMSLIELYRGDYDGWALLQTGQVGEWEIDQNNRTRFKGCHKSDLQDCPRTQTTALIPSEGLDLKPSSLESWVDRQEAVAVLLASSLRSPPQAVEEKVIQSLSYRKSLPICAIFVNG